MIHLREKPDVSVIMPIYNAEKFLEDAIDSVLSQSYENFELLLCEDGSQDMSMEISQSFVERDSRILLYRHPRGENKGVSATRNLGIDNARGHFIAFLDADDLLNIGSLSTRLSYFEQNPAVGFVFSAASIIDERGNPSQFNGSAIFGQFGAVGLSSRFESLLLEGNGICTSTVMIRRSYLSGLRFMEDLELQYEDWLLWILLSSRCHFYQHPETLSCYRIHEGQAIGESFFRYYCCCLYFYRRLVSLGWDPERIRSVRGNFLYGLLRASLSRKSHGLPLHLLCRYFFVYLNNKERADLWEAIFLYLRKHISCIGVRKK